MISVSNFILLITKALKDNGSNGYLVGSKLSLADIALFETVLTVEELLGAENLQSFDEIQVIFTFQIYY